MHFLLTGKDGKDEDALNRRMAARPAHLEGVDKLIKDGQLLFAGAILDENGKMAGSVMVFDFKSRTELDNYLSTEAYVKGNVWQEIEIQSMAIANAFLPEALRK